MKNTLILAAALCALASTDGLAQAGNVINEKDVNEGALVDMLTPPPRTRSIRVTRVGEPAAPAPSASLLITFETNSAQLTPQARKSLEVVGRALKSEKLNDYKFAIEGHADPRGNPDANMRLSKARAESVAAFLADAQQIKAERLKAVGKGQTEVINKENPAAPENRRVTIKTLAD
jgi:OmpA-OmpF porin, OOP family